MRSVINYVLRDVTRSRFVIVYAVAFVIISEILVRFLGADRVLPALINVVIPLVPLVSVVFAMSYVYHSMPTVEMLLTQPIKRSAVFGGLYIGMVLPVALIPAVSLGMPLVLRPGSIGAPVLLLVSMGILLSIVFIGIGFWIAMRFKDRVSGLAFALFVWLFLAVGYDGVVLVGTRLFADYPLEAPLLGAMMLNPVDLARVSLLTLSDMSAMMGYTGALFLRFFGSTFGLVIIASVLTAWIAIPAALTGRRFVARDF